MTPPCSPVFPAAVIARLDSTETHRPFDADEEDRRNDEDDEQEELERQERQDEEDGEDIYSDDLRAGSCWITVLTSMQQRWWTILALAGKHLSFTPQHSRMTLGFRL